MKKFSHLGIVLAFLLALVVFQPAYSGIFVEELYLDTYETNNDMFAGPVYSSASLTSGHDYLVTVEGTYSVWIPSAWNPPPCLGSTEPTPTYLSPGTNNGKVGVDVAYFFAVKDPSPLCDYPYIPYPRTSFQINTGSGWIETRPDDDTYNSDHIYTWTITGEGGPVAFRFSDNPTSDNYGQLKITIEKLMVEVKIDIKPGSYPNCFNINSHGVVPVAILGSSEFDVSQIDVSTIKFAGLDVRFKGNDSPQCSIEDASGPGGTPDGHDDLVCQFVDDAEAWTPDNGTATIIGDLLDGTPFEGTDEICLRPD